MQIRDQARVLGQKQANTHVLAQAYGAAHAQQVFEQKLAAGDRAAYGRFTKKEKVLSSENIRKHMHHLDKHPGGQEQAVAIGLHQAEKGEKEKAAHASKLALLGKRADDECKHGDAKGHAYCPGCGKKMKK